MADIDEIAPDVFRISVFAKTFGFTFNHFLIRDDEPLLYHTGLRGMFSEVRDGVAKVLDPARLRHVGFSHFEADECGALNQWLGVAPRAAPLCGLIAAAVNINDIADRPPRVLAAGETLSTGRHRFRLLPTPHLPHGWDASLLFEETGRILFSSDLLLQTGACPPLSTESIVDRARDDMVRGEAGPFAHAVPYRDATGAMLAMLADEAPRTIATMHGSSYAGDGAQALRDLATVMKEVLGPPA
jgi:flavorubredoxin